MANLSGWTEAVLFSLAFITILGIIVGGYNVMYNKNNDVGFSDSTTSQLFVNYTQTAKTRAEGGDVNLNSINGITLKTSYGIITDVLNICWTFISGGFIEKIASNLQVGASGMVLAFYLRVLFVISLIFALLAILFRVQP